ncbi:MAG: anti-sigma-F factor Fin [Bacillaceae bacterium]
MSIRYYCRYCGSLLGTIQHEHINEISIVLEQLSDDEKKEILSFSKDGNILIKTVCENCEQTLDGNPNYYEYDTFLQ